MKRTLLLIPVFVIALIACREKHVTSSSPTPGMPDPNGYTVPGNNGSSNNGSISSNGSGNTGTTGSAAADTIVTNVSMPNGNTGTTNVATAGDSLQPQVSQEIKIDSSRLCRLVVSFTSKGSGIDYETQSMFDKWLAKDDKGGFTFTKNPWGREGEVNYCFNLSAKSRAEQAAFVKEVREVIGEKDRVFVNEWAECTKGHQSAEVSPEPTELTRDTTNTVRLVVSFISKGQGIDHKTQEEFEKWLAERPQYTYEKTGWGREGEVNYCFRLTNIDGRQQEVFIRDVRTFMTGKDMVFVSEWEKCDKRK